MSFLSGRIRGRVKMCCLPRKQRKSLVLWMEHINCKLLPILKLKKLDFVSQIELIEIAL
jgi:hypothetical protein